MQLEVQLLVGRPLIVLWERGHRVRRAQGAHGAGMRPWALGPASSPVTLAMKDSVPLSFWAMTIL